MKKLTFTIDINASKEKVWYSLWDDENYKNWTTVFCEGSFTISDWKEGSKIYFLGPDGSGMNSKIDIKKPFDTMSFTHHGEVKEFKEQPETEMTKSWAGSEERYDLVEHNGVTTLTTSVDILESHEDFFNNSFPKALQKVKEIAEGETKTISVRISTTEPLEKAWNYYTQPERITQWCFPSDDWHCPKAVNDLKVNGTFSKTMASKDGKMSFDFAGTYLEIGPMKKIRYVIADGRKVSVTFEMMDGNVIITENFEPENENSLEIQRSGWQAILENFKKHLEN